MRKSFWKLLIGLVCITTLSGAVFGQSDLQRRFDSLVPGVTDLDQVKSIFGKPSSEKKGIEWKDLGAGQYEMLSGKEPINVNDKEQAGRRFLYSFDYPEAGLRFSFFDRPFQLESVLVESSQVSAYQLKIGSSLEEVRQRLGTSDNWWTTDNQDLWWLDYDDKGVRFAFRRDKKFPRYPMRLESPNVIEKFEKFDPRVSFF